MKKNKNISKEENNRTAVLENVDNGVYETAQTHNDTEMVKREIKKAKTAIRRAKRKRYRMNKKLGKSTIVDQDKLYTVLVQYHQLNYDSIKAALKELNITPSVIDNSRFWVNKIGFEDLEKLKTAMRGCHFTTKQGKQYKVRLAAYKYKERIKEEDTTAKKPTNNTLEIKKKARAARKKDNIDKYKNREGHKKRRANSQLLRSQWKKRASHKPGCSDTSSFSRKLADRIRKIAKAETTRQKNEARQKNAENNSKQKKPKNPKEKTLFES